MYLKIPLTPLKAFQTPTCHDFKISFTLLNDFNGFFGYPLSSFYVFIENFLLKGFFCFFQY